MKVEVGEMKKTNMIKKDIMKVIRNFEDKEYNTFYDFKKNLGGESPSAIIQWHSWMAVNELYYSILPIKDINQIIYAIQLIVKREWDYLQFLRKSDSSTRSFDCTLSRWGILDEVATKLGIDWMEG